MTECRYCKRDASQGVAGICLACLSPDAVRDRIDSLPENPLKDVMLKVGQDMGVVAPRPNDS
jgi:hypothetical protein